MNEDFLHFIWKFRLTGRIFHTNSGETLEVISTGEHNHDAGPDFLNARIKLGDTLWAGNVEIHVRSSDWIRHRHQHDSAYDNVILHVVYENDLEIRRRSGENIPALVLNGLIEPDVYDTYNYFLNNHLWIPCALRLPEVREIVVRDWLASLAIRRLERKAVEIGERLAFYANDWDQAFFEALSSTFGFRINKQPFELLARNTPVLYLEKHKDNLFQVEAMLFGQAGFLEGKYRTSYPKLLKKEYQHLRVKFGLEAISGHLWKFMRLRPNNFPTIRIAQLAMLIHTRSHFFSQIIQQSDYSQICDYFNVGVSDYWQSHYYFDRPSRNIGKTISTSTVDLIIINNVVPFLYLYAKHSGKEEYVDKAVALQEKINPESNSLIRKYAEFGIRPASAGESQGLIELKTNYCDRKRCLDCRIGLELIK
jgi:hypothetical protein